MQHYKKISNFVALIDNLTVENFYDIVMKTLQHR
jgi:hypothetical protein